ncbi:MAG: thermonuclease family protein [Candidatus Levyibacteriota bacterium]|nr:MAG: thermonuclease family protein [Candidatus Levybacteria bacterium]
MRKLDKPLFFFGILLILAGLIWSVVVPAPTVVQKTPSPVATNSAVLGAKNYQEAEVIRVVDGDTIHIQLDNKEEIVRFIGVDAPEVVDPRKKAQCFGKEASNFTKNMLNGKKIILEEDASQGNRDKYNRLLRYVFLEDGTNFNKLLIQEGYAHEYTYRLPYRYQVEFKEAQKQAESHKKGLWADNAC